MADQSPHLSIHADRDTGIDLEAWRSAAENLANLGIEPEGVEFRPRQVGPVSTIQAIPGGSPAAVFQWVHGGYALCSAQSHRKVVGHLASAAGIAGYSVEYRRPPEHPFPAAVEDIVAVHQALLREYPPDSIGLVADSGGGSVAGAALVTMQRRRIPLPCALVLFSPWTDLTLSGASMEGNASSDLFVTRSGLEALARVVAGGHDRRDPLLSPLFAPMEGWPPMLILVAELEVLFDDGSRLAESARAAGVGADFEVAEGMQHGFYFAAGNLPQADQALARAGDFLAEKLSGSGPG